MITIENNVHDTRVYTFRGIGVVSDDMFIINGDIRLARTESCNCGGILTPAYVYIIDKLRKDGLLPNNFVMKCCVCWNFEKRNRVKKK